MDKNTPYGFLPDPVVEGDYTTILMELLPPGEERPKHSYNDFPSQKKGNETFWHKRGLLHREGDKPAYIRNNSNSHMTFYERKWLQNNKEHRDGDKPSNIILETNTNPDDYSIKETSIYRYQINGVTHREGDKPAFIEIIKIFDSDSGEVTFLSYEEHFYKNGEEHRDGDKPAVRNVTVFKSGDRKIILKNEKEFYKEGKIHRHGDKPAVTKIHKYKNSGIMKSSEIVFGFEGHMHREGDKPALQKFMYSFEGKLLHKEELFYIHGALHREDNQPAVFRENLKKKLVIYSKFGEFDSSVYPAVCYTESSLDEDEKAKKIYYRFYSEGIEKKRKKEVIKFLFRELQKNDDSLNIEDLNIYPTSQVESIIFTITGIEYTQNIEDDIKIFNEIVNTRNGRYF